ncbi:hypothetical protein HPB47_005667 [Ixodes persulcatus]|uniref:Uncharacterized protein n=1 Tax=Ixodes persulcatus TaxID=34615 RepID=A0AC60PD58_IXOPE|nr:hypothetical protein HPB47_005667 [Ixodes persulcatus]
MTSSQVNGSFAAFVSGGPSIITAETSSMEIEAGNPLGKASGGETRRIRESSVSKKRKGEDLTKEEVIIEVKEEDMERSGCNDEYGSSNKEGQIPNYHKKNLQRGSRPSRRQQRQDGPLYTVIVMPTAAHVSKNPKFAVRKDQIRYAVSNGNNSIAVTVQTEEHAQDLMALKELPTEDPDKKIEVTVSRSTTGSQPRGAIHGVSPGDAARGIVENAIADYHDIIHAKLIGKNGTYLITFEGQGIPSSLRLFGGYHNVFPYKPTAVVCLQCHRLGHKATVCTRKQRCKTCGEAHPNNQPCQGKQCPNCKKTGHTVFEIEECQARKRADDKLQKRAADGRRNHGGGPEQQQAEQRKPKPTYSQALDSKVMSMDSVSHLGTPSGCSSRLVTELAQFRESSSRILQKIQRLDLEYENQLNQKQETRRAQAKATVEADRKRKQEAEQRLRIEQQKTDEARRRSQRCPATYEQETRDADIKLTGYIKYSQPTVTLTVKGKTRVQPQVAILVRKDLPQQQVDTREWCTDSQEVVAVLVESQCDGPILVVSVYYRPKTSTARRMNGDFHAIIHCLYFWRRGLCCWFGQARSMGRHAPSTTSPSRMDGGGAGQGVARVHPFLSFRCCRSGTRAMPLLRWCSPQGVWARVSTRLPGRRSQRRDGCHSRRPIPSLGSSLRTLNMRRQRLLSRRGASVGALAGRVSRPTSRDCTPWKLNLQLGRGGLPWLPIVQKGRLGCH